MVYIGKYERDVMRNQLCLVLLFIVVCLCVKSVSAVDSQIPTVDGIILDDEYSQSNVEPSTEIKVHWFNNEVHLWIGLRSPGLGWIAIGFEPEAPSDVFPKALVLGQPPVCMFAWNTFLPDSPADVRSPRSRRLRRRFWPCVASRMSFMISQAPRATRLIVSLLSQNSYRINFVM